MKRSALALAASSLVFSACNRDDEETPAPVSEEETITVLFVKAIRVGSTDTLTFTYRPQAVGNLPVRIDTVKLASGENYTFNLELYDETKNPIDDITKEVREEGYEHQFFYTTTPTGLINFPIANFDKDRDGRPVGLQVTGVNTNTTAGTGTLEIELLHDLNKAAAGVDQGNQANAAGSSDIKATFPVVLQ